MPNVVVDYVEVDGLEPFAEVVIFVSDTLDVDLDNYLISRNTGLPLVDRPSLDYLTSRQEVP
jgi:hypothetical protein